MSRKQYQRAFVLQMGPATAPSNGRFEGRVEHVASGRAMQFASIDEIKTFIAQMLSEKGDPTAEEKDA